MVWLKRDSLTVPLASFRPEIPAAPSLPPTTDGTGTRSAEVLSQLRKLVSEGRFPPGSKLPAERKLAEQLTVGRPVIREAIKVLTTLGILESRGGSGTYVKSTQPAEPFAAGLPDVKLPFKMLHLLEVQEVIEPRAAWLAATRAGERELAEIETARQRLEMHDRDWKLVARLDLEFHAAIFRGARNPVLALIHESVMGWILTSLSGTVHFSPSLERLRSDHLLIAEAILRRQADEAEQAMRRHWKAATQDFILGMQVLP